jgi:hypothetical protein
MTVEVLRRVEGETTSHPTVTGLSPKAAALERSALWSRLESWIAWRWGARQVVWTIQGEGEWVPDLCPVVSATAGLWNGTDWTPQTLAPAPLGYVLPAGTHRIEATVGSGEGVPEAVEEAFRRLAEYSVEIGSDTMTTGHPSHTSHDVNIAGSIEESFQRSATWAARAIHYSGAADLLRPYRRA